MAKLSIVAGSTSKLCRVFIRDSSKTDGSGLTGLTNATSGLTAYYIKEGSSSATQISLVSATLGTFTSSGFIVVDGTNMPGWYELGIPNAALSSAKSVAIMLKGAANMVPCNIEIELTATDNQDAVHGGMSALPNTACTTNGSLITSGSGTAQLLVSSGLVSMIAAQNPSVLSGTASAGGASTITLAGGVATDNYYRHLVVIITSGTGAGQANIISSYVGSTKVATMVSAWITQPDNTSVFTVLGDPQVAMDSNGAVLIQTGSGTGQLDFTSGVVKANVTQLLGTAWLTPGTAGTPDVNAKLIGGTSQTGADVGADATTLVARVAGNVNTSLRSNTAQAGAASTITLDASASATTDFYRFAIIKTTGGTGSGQARVCTAYNGSTKVATVDRPWATNPDNTTTFDIFLASELTQLDLTQAVPTSNTAETVGDCLMAARADGFGKWTLSGTTLTLYANDGTTALRTFTLDSSTAPTSRS